jgi:hypothetical protein
VATVVGRRDMATERERGRKHSDIELYRAVINTSRTQTRWHSLDHEADLQLQTQET